MHHKAWFVKDVLFLGPVSCGGLGKLPGEETGSKFIHIYTHNTHTTTRYTYIYERTRNRFSTASRVHRSGSLLDDKVGQLHIYIYIYR